jgi:hypothetical protein
MRIVEYLPFETQQRIIGDPQPDYEGRQRSAKPGGMNDQDVVSSAGFIRFWRRLLIVVSDRG